MALDPKRYMIIVKGEFKTKDIQHLKYDSKAGKFYITYHNSDTEYAYNATNVEFLKDSHSLNPNNYRISTEKGLLFNIKAIYAFDGKNDTYFHFVFDSDKNLHTDYCVSELSIETSALTHKQPNKVFSYIKEVASLSDLKNEYGMPILPGIYDKLNFVDPNTALAIYLDPSLLTKKKSSDTVVSIFPFGCNNSQYKAVKRAMSNQISVIQGPPGTGKTQTILNIIANILVQNKTVLVVSNNNSATDNIYEKLEKNNIEFVAAPLGNSDNKTAFVESQGKQYPNFSSWRSNKRDNDALIAIRELSRQLKDVFNWQEQLAHLRDEKLKLETERKHFDAYIRDYDIDSNDIKTRKTLTSQQWLELWIQFQLYADNDQKFGRWFRFKLYFRYGISGLKKHEQEIPEFITICQAHFYETKDAELTRQITEIENHLKSTNKNLLKELQDQSMAFLKNKLARKYEGKTIRPQFTEEDLWKHSQDVLQEYPVILSTTFSSRTSLNQDIMYDYVIMDEASQVDIATGALALSCARNAVIVGDTKQLPNIVEDKKKPRAAEIFNKYDINEGYRFTRSFLSSVLTIIPKVPKTMLREHYRCHPKIINFCNQKFYNDKLIVMTEDKGEDDVLIVDTSVVGNHKRGRVSQRQIDMITDEIIPKYVKNISETGIIAPYRDHVEAIQAAVNTQYPTLEVDTVHKFQGREKDTIIISTVDDEISDFADEPHLINVAVSRAKKQLIVIVSGNEQEGTHNITDLVDYIRYENGEVVTSKVRSIFDYLYQQYAQARWEYLRQHPKVSEYPSEDLMNAVIEEVISEGGYTDLAKTIHYPFQRLIEDLSVLDTERKYQYAMNKNTHVDFLLYNKVSKKPVLVVEVDGEAFHQKDSVQYERDMLKNEILASCGIPLLRLRTSGSGEKEKLKKALADALEKIKGTPGSDKDY